jgi:hypothetical protein
MIKTAPVFISLILVLTACAAPPLASPVPPPTATVALAALPTFTPPPEPTSTATQAIEGNLFSKISHSTSILHLKCDPLEIIFSVTVKNPQVKGVLFFFRMKDKATGLVNDWASGGNMRPVGNNMFEYNFRASAIPADGRYQDAWVQYQLVGLDKAQNSIGRSQIFSEEITFAPKCP